MRIIQASLQTAADFAGSDHLDSDVAAGALAAAEIVSALLGGPVDRTSHNESALDWIARTQPEAQPELVGLARRAVDRTIGSHSELAELWAEAGST